VGSDAALETERINFGRRQSGERAVPGRIGISTIDWKYRAPRHRGIIPSSDEVERNIETVLNCNFLQRQVVLLARARTAHRILVLNLNSDNRAAILPEKALELLADLHVPHTHMGKISRIVDAGRARRDQPIREAAVTRFSMCPRPYA